MVDLRPSDFLLLQKLLRRYIPDREVRLFGSRVKGTAKPSSDIDLAIMGDKVPSRVVIANLASALSASKLPFRVELTIWAETSKEFRRVIEKAYTVIKKSSLIADDLT